MELSMVNIFILFLVFMLGFFAGKIFTTVRYGLEYMNKFETLKEGYLKKIKKRKKAKKTPETK